MTSDPIDDLFAETEPETRPRPGRAKRRRRILAIVGLIVLVIGGLVWWGIASTLGSIEKLDRGEVFQEYEGRPDEAAAKPGEKPPLNILLLGSDSRGEGENLLEATGNRSDTIMVVHVSGDRQRIDIMSIMRDTWVDIPGHGPAKINAAYSYGGAPLLVQTVEGLIGQRIDHLALIDFEGFKGLTEAVGGVTLYNSVPFSTPAVGSQPAYEFPAGEITVQGEQALVFVRERYSFADGDYQRVRNQQAFMQGLMRKLMSRQTLTNPATMKNLIDSLGGYVAVDSGLDLGAMLDLGGSLANLDMSGVRSFTMPTSGTGSEGGQSVVYLNEEALPALRQAFADDTLSEYRSPGDR